MAEWSKALVLGTSHFGGAGSNPVPVKISIYARTFNELDQPDNQYVVLKELIYYIV